MLASAYCFDEGSDKRKYERLRRLRSEVKLSCVGLLLMMLLASLPIPESTSPLSLYIGDGGPPNDMLRGRCVLLVGKSVDIRFNGGRGSSFSSLPRRASGPFQPGRVGKPLGCERAVLGCGRSRCDAKRKSGLAGGALVG